MTNYEAIYNRVSVRKFKSELIPGEFFREMSSFLDELVPLYPEIGWKFVLFNALDDEGRAKGLFRVKAPYYLVCYTQEDERASKQAGYLTEQVVLYLTTHGIGTCYQGGATAEIDDEPEGMKQQIVVAFGYAEGEVYRKPGTVKRLPLKETCIFKEEPTTEESMILAAARLAPSSVNHQPWRFVIYRNRIHVFAREGLFGKTEMLRKMNDIDMGIVLYHLTVGCEELLVDGELVYIDQLAERKVQGNTYVMSLMLRN